MYNTLMDVIAALAAFADASMRLAFASLLVVLAVRGWQLLGGLAWLYAMSGECDCDPDGDGECAVVPRAAETAPAGAAPTNIVPFRNTTSRTASSTSR